MGCIKTFCLQNNVQKYINYKLWLKDLLIDLKMKPKLEGSCLEHTSKSDQYNLSTQP